MERGATSTFERSGPGHFKCYVLIFLAACLAMAWQFMFPGYYHMFALDAAMLPKYVSEFSESFRQGIIYPRWMADDFWGYGSPVFVLYSPLLYFVCSLIGFSGLGLVFIITMVKLVSLFVGAVFLYLYMRGRYGERAALLGAIFYTLLPTRIFDLYMQNTPAGRLGEMFLPMCIYFAGRLVEAHPRRIWYTGLAISFSGLILSHLASAYMFVPFLVGFAAACRRDIKISQALARVSVGLVLGILLSSFFFVPVLLERGLVHMEYLETTEIYEYWRHFVFAGLYHRNNPVLETVYSLLGGSIILEVGALSVLVYFMRIGIGFSLGRDTVFYIFASIFCLFMMSWLSAPLWDRISSLKLLIFSSRFAVYYLVFVSILFGIAADRLAGWERRPRRLNLLILISVLSLLLYGGNLIRLAHRSPDEYVNSLISLPNFQQEYLPKSVSLDSISIEPRVWRFSTAFAAPEEARPYKSSGIGPADPVISADSPVHASIMKWGYIDRDFGIEISQNTTVRVKTFYFPGWRAWIDGHETRLRAEEKTGAILVDVPAGRHNVELKFTDTPPRMAGKAISLLTLVALVFPYGRVRRSKDFPAREKNA